MSDDGDGLPGPEGVDLLGPLQAALRQAEAANLELIRQRDEAVAQAEALADRATEYGRQAIAADERAATAERERDEDREAAEASLLSYARAVDDAVAERDAAEAVAASLRTHLARMIDWSERGDQHYHPEAHSEFKDDLAAARAALEAAPPPDPPYTPPIERLVTAWRNLAAVQDQPVPADAPMHAISYESLVFLDIAYEVAGLIAGPAALESAPPIPGHVCVPECRPDAHIASAPPIPAPPCDDCTGQGVRLDGTRCITCGGSGVAPEEER